MIHRMNWDDLKIFLYVARTGGLTPAAGQLRMDPATIGRRIARLESALGRTLFLRSPQGYELTNEGERFLKTAEAMEFAAVQAADTMGADDTLTGVLRIGAPDGCANYLLPGVLAKLSAENPGLEAQILALPRVVNLSQREADLAIAVSRPSGGRLTVQKIADYRLSLAASVGYLDGAPTIERVEDLRSHRVVGYIPDMIFDKELDYLSSVGIERPHLASNSVAVQMNLLRAGGGVGFVHDFALAHAPGLMRLLPDKIGLKRTFWLVRHADERATVRLTRLAETLVTGLRREIQKAEHILDSARASTPG